MLSTIALSSPLRAQQPRLVILRFDDGYENQFQYAKPVLDEFGFKAVFAIPTAAISGESVNTETGGTKLNPDMNWTQVQGLYYDGMEIASHTRHHVHLNSVNASTLVSEINGSRYDFVDHGIPLPSTFVYPYGEGAHNATVVNKIFGSGYAVALGVGAFIFDVETVNVANVEGEGIDAGYRSTPAFFASVANRADGNIAVQFIFHGVGDHVHGVGNTLYINESDFIADMKYLKDNGFTVVAANQVWGAPQDSNSGTSASTSSYQTTGSRTTDSVDQQRHMPPNAYGFFGPGTFVILAAAIIVTALGVLATVAVVRKHQARFRSS
jgi:hypothetical protein